jgi:Ca-activated chloride channel family protein
MRVPTLQFAAPHWLWLSAGCAILVASLFLHAARARRKQLAEFADPERRDALLASHSPARRVVKNALLFAAVLLLGIALARPQWGVFEEQIERKGDDVVFLLDTSKSMLAASVARTGSSLQSKGFIPFAAACRRAGG